MVNIFNKYPPEKIAMPTQFLPDKTEKLFILKLVGNKMHPDIKNGDLLICKFVKEDNYEDFDLKTVVAVVNNETFIRKLDYFSNKLISTDGEEIELKFGDRIYGVVKGIWSNGY